MNRQEAAELLEARRAIVRRNILKNLLCSTAHQQLSVEDRVALADKLASEALSFDQPGYNNSEAATAWAPGDHETKTERFTAAMNYGDE